MTGLEILAQQYQSIDSDKHLVSVVIDSRIYLIEYDVLMDIFLTRRAFYLVPELEVRLSSLNLTEHIKVDSVEKTFIEKMVQEETKPNLNLRIKKYIYL